MEEYMDKYMSDCHQMFVKNKTQTDGPKCKIKKKLSEGIKTITLSIFASMENQNISQPKWKEKKGNFAGNLPEI